MSQRSRTSSGWVMFRVLPALGLLASTPATTNAQEVTGNAQACAGAPALPPSPSLETGSFEWFAEPTRVEYWEEGGMVPLGVGHLALVDGGHSYDWPDHVALPLWRAPDSTFSGWIAAGRLWGSEGGATELTGAGTVETGYEVQTLYVLQAEDSGWLRIRVSMPSPQDPGLRWTHACHLALGDQAVYFESWADVLTQHGEWLFFRTADDRSLYDQPTTDRSPSHRLSDDHRIELLEIDGPWARVRVHEPDRSCYGDEEEFDVAVREGWVRWFDDRVGPRLWYPTRGC